MMPLPDSCLELRAASSCSIQMASPEHTVAPIFDDLFGFMDWLSPLRNYRVFGPGRMLSFNEGTHNQKKVLSSFNLVQKLSNFLIMYHSTF
jgi:hypothetical protein